MEDKFDRLTVKDESPRRSSTICQSKGIMEVQDEDCSQKFDLSNYLYHKIVTTDYDIEIKVYFASHAFLPKNKRLTFGSMDERDTFVTELKQSMETRRETSYANQVEVFLEQQFETWTAGQECPQTRISTCRALTVPKEKIVAFIKKVRIDRDMNIRELSMKCNFHGWRKLYHKMLKLKTSELLATVFNNYSIWKGESEPREMTREMLREFLQPPGFLGLQNETNVSEEYLTKIIQVFSYKVSFKKTYYQIGLGNRADVTSASQGTSWDLESFTNWLLSEANDIQVGKSGGFGIEGDLENALTRIRGSWKCTKT